MSNIKILMVLMAINLSLVSCKDSPEVEETKKEEERGLSAQEEQDLQKICGDLKAKREYFESLDDNIHRFNFKTMKKNCGESRSFELGSFYVTLRSPLASRIYFKSPRRRFLPDILTDKDGPIARYCEASFNGERVYNTQVIDNGNQKIRMVMSKQNRHYYIEFGNFKKNSHSQFELSSVEGFQIISGLNTPEEEFHGMVKERVISQKCLGTTPEEFRQVFNY